jgi:hypothetical protein
MGLELTRSTQLAPPKKMLQFEAAAAGAGIAVAVARAALRRVRRLVLANMMVLRVSWLEFAT